MAEIWRSEYPFASHFLPIGPHRLHYVDEAPRVDEGPRDTVEPGPLLCVHGNPTWSFYWRRWIDRFQTRRRIVAPDHLGCGLSDKPGDYSYRLADHVENLVRLIDERDLRDVTLVAHDWGGAIGLGAAVRRPERFSRFILCNTGAFRSDRCPWRIRVCRMPLLGPLAVRGANAFVRAALRTATSKPERFTAQVRAGYLAPYDSFAHRVAVQRFVEDIPLAESHPSYRTLFDIERGLASLADRPVLLAWGLRDWCFTPHFLERFREFFPRAEVRRYPDAGHFVVEDARDELLRDAAEFLDRTESARSRIVS